MLNGEVVGDDEEVDGIEVVLGVLGEGISLTHQATDAGPRGAKPAFDVVGSAPAVKRGVKGSVKDS